MRNTIALNKAKLTEALTWLQMISRRCCNSWLKVRLPGARSAWQYAPKFLPSLWTVDAAAMKRHMTNLRGDGHLLVRHQTNHGKIWTAWIYIARAEASSQQVQQGQRWQEQQQQMQHQGLQSDSELLCLLILGNEGRRNVNVNCNPNTSRKIRRSGDNNERQLGFTHLRSDDDAPRA